jgi:hypothetical protein
MWHVHDSFVLPFSFFAFSRSVPFKFLQGRLLSSRGSSRSTFDVLEATLKPAPLPHRGLGLRDENDPPLGSGNASHASLAGIVTCLGSQSSSHACACGFTTIMMMCKVYGTGPQVDFLWRATLFANQSPRLDLRLIATRCWKHFSNHKVVSSSVEHSSIARCQCRDQNPVGTDVTTLENSIFVDNAVLSPTH